MSSSSTIEPFNGINGEECNNFIRSIRAAAWKEGKLRDLSWVADFASLHFSHQALLWHSQLPHDVRQDWGKLEVELLNRWTPPKYEDGPRIEPTPAAAPSLNRNDRADRSPQGILKVVVDGSSRDYYLKLDEEDDAFGVLTDNANEAVRIRCNSLSNATLLELTHRPRHSLLAFYWATLNLEPDFTKGSTEYGHLTRIETFKLKTYYWGNTPRQLALWTVSADGELIPVWEDHDTGIPLGGFCCDESGEGLFLASDSAAYSRETPEMKRAKFFIQQTD